MSSLLSGFLNHPKLNKNHHQQRTLAHEISAILQQAVRRALITTDYNPTGQYLRPKKGPGHCYRYLNIISLAHHRTDKLQKTLRSNNVLAMTSQVNSCYLWNELLLQSLLLALHRVPTEYNHVIIIIFNDLCTTRTNI